MKWRLNDSAAHGPWLGGAARAAEREAAGGARGAQCVGVEATDLVRKYLSVSR